MLGHLVTLKAGETYEVAQGIEAIKRAVRRAHSVQIYDPPSRLLSELTPYLAGKQVTIYLLPRDKVADQLHPQVVRIKNRIKAAYHGRTMFLASIRLTRVMFDIIWRGDRIYDISAITISKCLHCTHRANIHSSAEHNGLKLGSVLPVSQALMEIERHLRQAAWAFFTNIPPEVISQFMTALHNREVKLILPHGTQIPPQLKPVKQARTIPRLVNTRSRIYGREVHCGGICLPHIHFGIGWEGNEIVSVRSFEWLKCVQCLHDIHRLGWHFCKRIW
jgi:hypothetical protein